MKPSNSLLYSIHEEYLDKGIQEIASLPRAANMYDDVPTRGGFRTGDHAPRVRSVKKSLANFNRDSDHMVFERAILSRYLVEFVRRR